jgi:ADP-heptose:LPS heptosyltransferase
MAVRVLVVRLGAMGDVVLTTGVLAALGKVAEVDCLVKPAFAPLLAPLVRRVLPLGTALPRDYDAVLDLHDVLRTRILRWRLGVRTVVWHKRSHWENAAVRLRLHPFRPTSHVTERYFVAAERLIGHPMPREQPQLRLQPQWQGELVGFPAGAVALCPGAAWATKRWALDRFVTLAARIRARGLAVIVTGNEADAERCSGHFPAGEIWAGRLSIGGLAAALARCHAVVTPDSGPLHLATALGVPAVALFGSTSPDQFDLSTHAVLRATLPCAPCHFYGRPACPLGHLQCMDHSVDAVWEALLGRLGHVARAKPSE